MFALMKEKQKGGPRKGAGRKPSTNPKEPVTVFVETKTIQLYGGKDVIRQAIYGFLKSDDMPELMPEAKKEIKPIKIKALAKPKSVLKLQKQPETNFAIDTRPKNIDELKSRCPPEKMGIDRTIWISEQKEKYGI